MSRYRTIGATDRSAYRVSSSPLDTDRRRRQRSAIDVLDLVVIDGGWYRVPSRPGYSAQMQPETLSRFAFAAGAEWAIGKE